MTEPTSPVVPEVPAPASPPAPAAAPPPVPPVPAAPPRGPRAWLGTALVNLASLAAVALPSLYYFRLGLQVRGERTVALAAAIPWPYYLLTLLVAVGLAVFAVVRAVRGESPDSPRFRLLPIAAVVFVSAELFAINSPNMPIPPDDLIGAQLISFEEVLTADGTLPPDPALLSKVLSMPLPPPFRRDGEQMTAWSYLVRADCDGPIAQLPAGVEAGAILVCLAPDRRSAWLTAVGIDGRLLGPPKLVSEPGESKPLVVQVRAISEQEAQADALDSMNGIPADAVLEDESASPGEP